MNRPSKQSRLFKATGSVACIVTLLAMLGGHWLLLQSFAWARMLVTYSQHSSLRSAITRTFDGNHPCPLCHSIRQARQQEQAEHNNQPGVQPNRAPELLCEVRRTVAPLPPTAATSAVPFVPPCHADFRTPPPVPPPRLATSLPRSTRLVVQVGQPLS